MTPEERAAFEERMKQRQAQGGGRGGRGGGPAAGGGDFGGRGGQGGGNAGNVQRGGPGAGDPAAATSSAMAARAARPAASCREQAANVEVSGDDVGDDDRRAVRAAADVETRGRAWLFINKQLKPVEPAPRASATARSPRC